MKILAKLEKQREFWYVLVLSLVFFLLRLPSLIEPYWYGDEGIYEVIGLALQKGRLLYSEAWDNKPPLLYVVYALFGPDQFTVRLASLVFGLGSVVSFFYLSCRLLNTIRASLVSTFLFAFFFATPIIEGNVANAENFMLFPIILAAVFIWTASESTKSETSVTPLTTIRVLAGALLGIAFLFKIVGIFDFLAFVFFSTFIAMPYGQSLHTLIKKKTLSILGKPTLPLLIGFLIPYFLTLVYFFLHNALPQYIHATFFSNVDYVGYKNAFLVPQGLLLLKVLFLACAVVLLFLARHRFTRAQLFVLLWVVFSLFNAFFSQRPYTHYVLVLLPSLSFLAGSTLVAKGKRQILLGMLFISCLLLVYTNFSTYSVKKTVQYYENFIHFMTQQKSSHDYQTFFDADTPRDYEVASFLRSQMQSTDTAFVWGNSAQIYVLADTLPPGRYTVAYHIVGNATTRAETERDLEKTKPRFIVILPDLSYFPFSLSNYAQSYTIRDTVIYERIF